ncbi:MAG TPA: CDP-diacylglycerol--serine O-phosphatidyltransferase [Planctomycetota bacterium]|nr:CDP-diacylglycerol--serine O-phosphatidyltransferase [Planctomycetota bacterium]
MNETEALVSGPGAEAEGAAPVPPAPRRRPKPIQFLPTAVTLGNLFSGFLAIAYLTDSMHVDAGDAAARVELYKSAMLWIVLAMVFDAFDGKIARMTGAASDFGAQIDSLSDVVSFGAAPALLFKVMVEAEPGVVPPKLAVTLAVVYLACAALRLARFNVETDLSEEAHRSFKGLPSPAAAAAVLAVAYANLSLDPARGQSWLRYAMPVLTPLFGFLMVSRAPYIHVANRLFGGGIRFRTLVALIFLVALVLAAPEIFVPLAVLLYVASGPIEWLRRRSRRTREPRPSGVVDEDDDEEALV